MATIMVIDDDPEIRDMIAKIVGDEGHRALLAADVAEAWLQLDEKPMGIFVDIDMPGETGVEFVLRLREHPECRDVPVVFVTAYRERARPLLASGATGVVDVVDKPFRVDTIKDRLQRLLEYKPDEAA